MNNRCCICVINHKTTLADFEQLSLLRIVDFCIQTNKLDDLIFVLPKSNVESFKDFCDTYVNKFTNDKFGYSYNFNFIYYDDICFSSLNAYNNMLMLSENFYGDYSASYDYMLVYQLDGYIFDNQLDYFLDKNYDYIGGYYLPMYCDRLAYKNFDNINDKHLLMNGGVSLKKISFCIDCIENNFQNINGCDFDNIHSYMNEDAFFSMFYTTEVTALESIKFSLNWAAAESHYAINNFKYPFCCHGINKSNFLLKLVEKYNQENNLDYSQYM